MKTRMLTFGATVATVSMLGTMMAPGVAHASAKGRKNTAIGLGAAAAHQILTGKTTNGVLLGAGAAYAYKRYKDAENDEKRRNRTANVYRNRYRTNASGTRTVNRTTRTRAGAANRVTTTRRTFPETRNTFVPNGSYYFTGKVIGGANDLTNRSITIDHNGVSRRVHVPREATVVHAGEKMSMHELRNGDLVRVLAVRTNSDRWNASRVELLNAVDAQDAISNRDPFGDPYIRRGGATTTTTTTATRRYNGVGYVERISENGNRIDVRVGTTVRTVYVDGADFRGLSGLSDLREGDRVRVIGDLDGSDVSAREVHLLD